MEQNFHTLMDRLGNFQVSEVVHKQNIDVCIGEIGSEKSIYINPGPSITKEDLQDIFTNGKFTIRDERIAFECVRFPKLIFPAEETHIKKHTSQLCYKTETYSEYLTSKDHLRTSWVDNVIGKKLEFFHLETDEYVVISDYKWDGRDVGALYLLVIFKDSSLRSIRDLTDYAIVERAMQDAKRYCKEAYSISEESLCLYFHYRPSYFRMHMHVVNISRKPGMLGFLFRDVLADDVIKNLQIDPEYYKKDVSFTDN